jgi:molybdenum cofactor guanylyltransferase
MTNAARPCVCALILAGGAARRMGGTDKPLLRLGGKTLLARILAALRPGLPDIALSANGDPARFAAFGLPVLPDPIPGQGPLGGLLAGLDWAATRGAGALLSVPGDTPFIPIDLAARLAPAPAWAMTHGQVHPLVALWPVSARESLRRLLSGPGPRAARPFGERLGMRAVALPEGPPDSCLNINTPDELRAAEALLAAIHA